MDSAILALPIQRVSIRVDHASQHVRTHADRWTRAPCHNFVSESNPLRLIRNHRQHRRSAKPDDLARATASVLTCERAGFSHRAERAFRFNQITHHLRDPPGPAQRRSNAKVVSVRRQQLAAHLPPGLNASKSKNPCSTSFNCASIPKFAEPNAVSSKQSSSLNCASSVTVTCAIFAKPAKYCFQLSPRPRPTRTVTFEPSFILSTAKRTS